EKKSYLLYSSYYILYVLYEIAFYKEIEINLDHLKDIVKEIPSAVKIIEEIIVRERQAIGSDTYSDAMFFKSSNPKKHLKELIDNGEIENYIKI
ncbi:MAG: hypothetical protein K8S14_09850, partial [Actinomycetia bacterium]|nr:hypothetical protein [Actinomycetes bacterium]